MGHLEIVVPPDIISDESSDNGVALEGGSVRLRCKATGVPDPTVQWRREDSKNIVLRHEGGREKTGETAPVLSSCDYFLFCFVVISFVRSLLTSFA